ncbi:MAG TPA: carboxypeptidase-like regulatory domain-containing protein [Candidatus Hydrogenedentes bacterium]|nr:carboxypeptidase-like regulatory domain-containing protein [Candidatus Hydrogenedentota bacterium]HOS01735.1 carboxypeptidase-like regulatory domain-containing protein [Candidatus Hydrogenedentota bacterium]
MKWRTALASVAAMTIIGGCGDPKSSAPPRFATSETAPAPQAAEVSASATFTATIKVVDKDGNPLHGMMPIATRQPNAFDPPLARGPLTGPSGISAFELPNNTSLYIRAWDPQQHLFANNYFEALPADGNRTPEMKIVMYPASRLEAVLTIQDGIPLANAAAGLMLSHPTLGPWWPSEARTDAAGRIVFEPLPPGNYAARVKAETGEARELPDLLLMPGKTVSLPPLALN